MEPSFSPAKIKGQEPILASLHGQEEAVHRNFNMAKRLKVKEEIVETRFKQPLRRTFIREWRKARTKTQGDLAEHLGVSIATISQIENGKSPYSQGQLEGIADLLGCEPADLLMRNPADPEGIWSLWEKAKPADRPRILRIIKAALASDVA